MNIPFIILLAVCVAISGYAGRLFFIGRRSRSWPSVQGTIITSRIDHISAGRTGVTVVFVLEYSYAVNGRGYSGNRVAMGPPGWFSIGRPGELQKRYAKGNTVTVFYDPANPALCALMSGAPRGMWPFYAIAAMFAVIGLALLVSLLLN